MTSAVYFLSDAHQSKSGTAAPMWGSESILNVNENPFMDTEIGGENRSLHYA